jgi:shikimate kinase
MEIDPDLARRIRAALGQTSLVLVGMMGAGKSSVGKRLAAGLGLPFVDADTEIEAAAHMTIPEIFAAHGEPYFRDGEVRVISRLLETGSTVLATGGGAFMNETTREHIKARGLSVYLKAEVDVLMKRVRRRANRPLLQTPDPEGTLRRLLDERKSTYELADLILDSHDETHETVVLRLVDRLANHFGLEAAV